MNELFTLEDTNTAIQKYACKSFVHKIDTSLIDITGDYSEVYYDFVRVSKETLDDGHGNTYTKFTFGVVNEYWQSRKYYFETGDGEYYSPFNVKSIPSEQTLIVKDYDESDIVLCLLIIPYAPLNYNFTHVNFISNGSDELFLTLEDLKEHSFELLNLSEMAVEEVFKQNLTVGHYEITSPYNVSYFIHLLKTYFLFDCEQDLIVGKKNTVRLGVNADYLPNGDLIGNYTPTITVNYQGNVLPVTYDNELEDYIFELDLSDKTSAGKVTFNVSVESNKVLNETTTKVVLDSDYQLINSFAELQAACGTSGINVFKLGTNIRLTANLLIKHSIKIFGNDKTLDFNSYQMSIIQDGELVITDCTLQEGNPCIIQNKGSKVILNNCNFINSISSDYNNLGSCIFCDNDIEGLELSDDFLTELTDCYFYNNNTPILHGGTLIIKDCRFRVKDTKYLNPNNPAFIYQTDGALTITGSVFDIDLYEDDSFCDHIQGQGLGLTQSDFEKPYRSNINFAQSILTLGKGASVNGAVYNDLLKDNSLPLFDYPYNNLSHLFAKYYYPAIESCVYSSPIQNKENQACCHTVSGLDYVFKNNVQVTRAGWHTENTINNLTWED